MFLREIARMVGMSTSKVYRHLASFVEIGLARQEEGSGRYDLGPAAIQLGLAALGRIDAIAIAGEGLARASAQADLDAHLTVWGDYGPTVVRWRGRPTEVAIRVSEGHVLPLASSATGRLWLAYLPASMTGTLLTRELATRAKGQKRTRKEMRADLDADLARIRETGVSISFEERRRGFDALSVPVFDRENEIAFALTVIGLHGAVDFEPDGPVARVLRRVADETSSRLGHDVAERIRSGAAD